MSGPVRRATFWEQWRPIWANLTSSDGTTDRTAAWMTAWSDTDQLARVVAYHPTRAIGGPVWLSYADVETRHPTADQHAS